MNAAAIPSLPFAGSWIPSAPASMRLRPGWAGADGPAGGLELRVAGTRLILHPLMLLFPLLAAQLGMGSAVWTLVLSLAVHEGAHLAAARVAGVKVRSLRLMPFGGSLDIGNPYALTPGRLFAIALAGPLGNLLLTLAGTALAQAGWLGPRPLLSLVSLNLALMLFNLLPALPLDGGRMLYALLSPRLGRARAASWGVGAGVATAALLAALAVLGWWRAGRLNLSPLLAAVFILGALPEERRALSDSRARILLSALRPIRRPVPARLVAVSGGCSVREALAAVAPDAVTLFTVYEGDRLAGVTDDRALLGVAAEGQADRALSSLSVLQRCARPRST